MENIKIEASEIVRYADENGLPIVKRGVGDYNKYCARAILAHAYLGSCEDMYGEELEIATGLTPNDVDALEAGFEGFGKHQENPYYNIGWDVAILAGV